jgi:alcohol dehydrogenase class IV
MSKQKIIICSNYRNALVSLKVFQKAKKIFIFCTKSFYNQIIDLKNSNQGSIFYIFSDLVPNPQLEKIKECIIIFKKFNPDLVITIGGGSCIDFAKIVNFLSVQRYECLDIVKNKVRVLKLPVQVIAVPTTAGSGSESTRFATFYVNYLKYSLEHDFILPQYVILDSTTTFTMSSYLTAVTGMDSLSQAIESYWSVHANKKSKVYATKAIKIILDHFINSVKTPCINSRFNMLLAANLSGRAINITKTTAPHAFSYCLTSHFNIPHGHAVAIFLPFFLKINSSWEILTVNSKITKLKLQNRMRQLYKIMRCKDSSEAIQKIKSLLNQLNLCDNLEELKVDKVQFQKIVQSELNFERLSNNPIIVSKEIIDDIFRQL